MILRRPVFWLILIFAALMAYIPLHANNVSLREDLILVAIAIILASNLNLMIGYTGYVNFGHIVFYGLGGYVGLYLATVRNWNLVLAALAGRAGGQPVARCCSGMGILRLRGAYFALATIGVLLAVQSFVSNFDPWGRSTGMYVSFDAYETLGGARHALWITYFLVIGVMALSMILSLGIKISKFGLGLFAIREDEDAAVVLGVNATVLQGNHLQRVGISAGGGRRADVLQERHDRSLDRLRIHALAGGNRDADARRQRHGGRRGFGRRLVRETALLPVDFSQALQLPPGDCRRTAAAGGAVCARRPDRLALSPGAARRAR